MSLENKTVFIGGYTKNLELDGQKIESPFADYRRTFFVGEVNKNGSIAVSYTHLTLPTKA